MKTKIEFGGSVSTTTVTIASGSTTSGVCSVPDGLTPVGFSTPGTMTGTSMTFTACNTSTGTFLALKNDTGSISYTTAASGHYKLLPTDFASVMHLKFVSGSTEGGDRIITVYFRALA